MKRIALAAVAVIALACMSTATAAPESNNVPNSTQHHAPPRHCTIEGFRPFSATVWRLGAWERGNPPKQVLEARTAAMGCATLGHRQAMKRTWRRDAKAFFDYRTYRTNNPWRGCTTYSGCGYYAIPAPIVECESGGRFHDPNAPNGGYSMLDGPHQGVPTWEDWRPAWARGYASPWEAPRRAQDEAALYGWEKYEGEPWECKA